MRAPYPTARKKAESQTKPPEIPRPAASQRVRAVSSSVLRDEHEITQLTPDCVNPPSSSSGNSGRTQYFIYFFFDEEEMNDPVTASESLLASRRHLD